MYPCKEISGTSAEAENLRAEAQNLRGILWILVPRFQISQDFGRQISQILSFWRDSTLRSFWSKHFGFQIWDIWGFPKSFDAFGSQVSDLRNFWLSHLSDLRFLRVWALGSLRSQAICSQIIFWRSLCISIGFSSQTWNFQVSWLSDHRDLRHLGS